MQIYFENAGGEYVSQMDPGYNYHHDWFIVVKSALLFPISTIINQHKACPKYLISYLRNYLGKDH